MKTQEQISKDYEVHAQSFIDLYNDMITKGVEPMVDFKASVQKFADIDDTTNVATYNSNKFDQMVNDTLTNEEYADMKIIGEQWKKGLYNPT